MVDPEVVKSLVVIGLIVSLIGSWVWEELRGR